MSELAKIDIEFHGPAATHNYPCPVCLRRHAVYYYTSRYGGGFKPCAECESGGWIVGKDRAMSMFWIGFFVGLGVMLVLALVTLVLVYVYVNENASGPRF